MKVVIIGGVAGGATAAARLRRLDEKAEIVILEKSGYVSYANCGLPYYAGGVIRDKRALTLQTPESFRRRFAVDVRVGSEAVEIDPAKKTVRVRRTGDGSEYTESYDKLLLAPGSKPICPNLPGIGGERIFMLHTVEETLALREFLEKNHPESAVIVGGGFIGLEAAENLINLGIRTTLLQKDDQVLPPLDYDMACQVHAYLRGQGLDLHLNSAVTGFEPARDGVRVLRKDCPPIDCGFVLLAAGVVPNTELAKKAGLALGVKGAITVNERMETSAPDIYAAGDAAEVRHFVSGTKTLVSLAGPANRQGRVAADNICGGNSRYADPQGSSVIQLFRMTAASTGLNEKTARDAGLRCSCAVTYSSSHASYYPDSTNMTVKTLFDPDTGRILGAQIVGFDGVDKRIDVFASAIRAGMTAADLEELDLAYAPPYSTAKDPVNMAGYVIENVRAGLVKQFFWSDVAGLPEDGSAALLDVRTAGEFAEGHIPGAVNIPLDELRGRLGELDASKALYVNCFSGLRSYLACRILSQNGFRCFNLAGGYRFYDYVMTEKKYDASPTYLCGIKIKP